jgi:5-methylcytosine-specific restriction endonuclease McrA
MNTEITRMTDEDLVEATKRAAELERQSTVELLTLLIEIERRELQLALGYSSMFTYCTRALLETHDKLQRTRALLRHSVPDGDLEAIIDRALTLLLREGERTKWASSRRPRPASSASTSGRRVPAAVKRAVWERDAGRCAFVGPDGRCDETGFLEFHHVIPFSAGGKTDVDNLELRCRAHNQHEANMAGVSAGRTRRAASW